MKSLTTLQLLLVFFLLCFASRLLLLFITGQVLWSQHHELYNLAQSIAEGRGYGNPYAVPTGPTSHFSPGVPLVLAAALKLFGNGIVGDIATYAVNAAAVSLVYAFLPITSVFIGLPRRSGLIAALIGMLVPIHFLIELKDSLGCFAALCLEALVLLTAWMWREERLTTRFGALYGLACGVILLFSPQLLLICVAFLVFTSLRYRTAALRFAAATAGIAVCVLLPWAVRNAAVLGSPIFLRGNFGLELQVSNNDLSGPSIAQNAESFKYYHPVVNRAECDRIVRFGEVLYMHAKLQQAANWIRSHPQHFAVLTADRARLFWFPKAYRWYQTALIWALTSMALAALVMVQNSQRVAFGIIAAIWAIYPLVYYVVQWDNRYRYPIHWTVLLMAAHLIVRSSDAILARLRADSLRLQEGKFTKVANMGCVTTPSTNSLLKNVLSLQL